MMICETANAAELFVREIETALEQWNNHVQVLLSVDGHSTVEIDSITAYPMQQGWGSKALRMICDLASQRQITLSLDVLEDDFDDDDEDEDEEPPTSDDLIHWYSSFGFTIIEPERYDRTRMARSPH